MTALLTPEQLAGIVKRDKHHSDPVVTSHTDRRALLRDREAICERHIKLATEYRALEAKLAKVRKVVEQNTRGSTHYKGCEHHHPLCRIAAIIKEHTS